MTYQIKVQKFAGIVGAVAVLVSVQSTSLQAQADTVSLQQQQLLSVDKKKKQEQKAPAVPRSKSASDYGRIGSNPRTGREVSPKCEDAYALAGQIMAGGPVDRQVYGRTLGNMDASQNLPTPPFEPRMQPRNLDAPSAARTGMTEIRKSEISMQRGYNPAGRMYGC